MKPTLFSCMTLVVLFSQFGGCLQEGDFFKDVNAENDYGNEETETNKHWAYSKR